MILTIWAWVAWAELAVVVILLGVVIWLLRIMGHFFDGFGW